MCLGGAPRACHSVFVEKWNSTLKHGTINKDAIHSHLNGTKTIFGSPTVPKIPFHSNDVALPDDCKRNTLDKIWKVIDVKTHFVRRCSPVLWLQLRDCSSCWLLQLLQTSVTLALWCSQTLCGAQVEDCCQFSRHRLLQSLSHAKLELLTLARDFCAQGPRSYFESGELTSDSKWGG